MLASAGATRRARRVPAALEALRAEALGEHQLTVESCDDREQRPARVAAGAHRRRGQEARAAARQDRQRDAPTTRTTSRWRRSEVDASVEAAGEYRAMLDRLRADDLPRFEARFKELLNENTIREVANFQSQLHRERADHQGAHRHASTSRCAQIDYNPGRYIVLEAEPTPDADVRDFQQRPARLHRRRADRLGRRRSIPRRSSSR